MKYQLFTWLPWWFNRYVLFKKDAVLKPLYQFDVVDRVSSEDESEITDSKVQAELHEDPAEKDATITTQS